MITAFSTHKKAQIRKREQGETDITIELAADPPVRQSQAKKIKIMKGESNNGLFKFHFERLCIIGNAFASRFVHTYFVTSVDRAASKTATTGKIHMNKNAI